MSIVVNTNIASMNAQRSLASSGKDLQQAMERLSTGSKINSAADDAAGFAIAESMTAQIRGLSMSAKKFKRRIRFVKSCRERYERCHRHAAANPRTRGTSTKRDQ